jgi:hypothetical protein
MKKLFFWLCCFSLIASAAAKPAGFAFVPGKSFGPVQLGDTFSQCVAKLPGWTYNDDGSGYVIGPSFVFPREAKGTLTQFILGFTPKKVLRNVEIHDESCYLEGHPKVRLGCTLKDVEAALGPARPGSYPTQLDYPHLGIRFNFEDGRPERATPPFNVPQFKTGQCEWIQIFARE